VSGDYLKQIQLTKQLEQKTKEAARNRKEAEERMAEAEMAIASLKAFDAAAAPAGKALEEANQAFHQKDYKLALSQSHKAMEAVEEAKRDKVSSIIASAEKLLNLFEEKAVPREVGALVSRSKELLDQGKMEDSLAKSRELWNASERFANSKVAETFATAQSLVLMAEKMGLDVKGERQMLLQARRNLESEDFGECVSQLRDCMDMTSTALRNSFSSRSESIASIAEQAHALDIDFTKAKDTLAKAKASSDKGDFEHAFGNLGIAESEANAIVSKGLLAKLDLLRERASFLKEMGVDVSELSAKVSQGREMGRTERLTEGIEVWRDAEGLARSQEMEQLVVIITRLRGRLLIANKIGSDITGVMDALDSARATLGKGDFKGAALMVKAAEANLERLLEGYREVETELSRTRSLMTVAIDLKLNITEAKRKVDASRTLVLRKDFGRAIQELKEAQEAVHGAIQAHIGQDIMRAEMRVTTALKVGVDIAEESALLEDIVTRTKAGRYDQVREDLDLCIRKVDAKVHLIAERTLAEAKNLLDTYDGPVNVATHRNTLQMANDALKEGQAIRAYDLAVSSMAMVRRDERNALERRLEETRQLLSIAKEIGSESVTLNEKLSKAEELSSAGNVAESLRVAEEVLQFARSIVKDEVTRQLALLTRSVSAARKNGIEVLKAERLSEEASRVLGKGDLLKGYSLMREAESTLERLMAVHARIYDRVVEISSMLKEAEAQQLDASKQTEMLVQAKRLFEAGRYEEALPAIAKTFVETEKLVAPFVAPRKAQAAQDLIHVAKRLGFEVNAPQKRLDSALRLIERKEYAQAMISVREVEKTVVSVLTKGVEKELAEAKAMLERARSLGSDISAPQQIVSKAESLLREKRLYDALRALELAKTELDQGLLMSAKASDTMERAQAIINDAQEFGVQVEPAMELLRQARNYHKNGRYGIAHELSKKAGDQVALASADMVRERMRTAESAQRQKGLEGLDLEVVLRMKADVERRLEARKFREAAAQVRSFETELEKVGAQKAMSAKALEDVSSKLEEARRKGLSIQEVDAWLSQANDRYAQGAFYEAYAMASKCGDELRARADLYDRRQSELKALEEELAQLEGEEVATAVKELAEAARRSIASLDFESASLYLRRGRQATKEAFESIQAERMKNLENMCMVAEELKVNKTSIPSVVKEVAKLRGTGKQPDPIKLREAVSAMNQVMQKKIEARIETVQDEVKEANKSGADVTASTELLAKAVAMLAEGKWRGAANCVMESERSIGVAVEEQRSYIEDRLKVEAHIENSRRNGLEMHEAIRLYRLAEKTKETDHAAARQRMTEALLAAEMAAEEFLPDIQVDLHFVDALRPNEWGRAQLRLGNEAKAMAREVTVLIGGQMEMRNFVPLAKLRGGERVSVDVEVRPKVDGVAHVTLSLECRPVLSHDKVGYDTEFDVDV